MFCVLSTLKVNSHSYIPSDFYSHLSVFDQNCGSVVEWPKWKHFQAKNFANWEMKTRDRRGIWAMDQIFLASDCQKIRSTYYCNNLEVHLKSMTHKYSWNSCTLILDKVNGHTRISLFVPILTFSHLCNIFEQFSI